MTSLSHLHRFAVDCALPLPNDPSCRSLAVDESRDRLKISVHDVSRLPCQLAQVQRKEIYDLGDSVLIWRNNFGMQLDFSVRHLQIYLPHVEQWALSIKTVLNVALSAATYLRGELPLHAGAVSLDGQFFGVLAASGTGKSTLVWSLVQSGALFGNDDLVNVQVDTERPLAMPSVSLFPKLCRPSLSERADNTPIAETYDGSGEFWMQIKPIQRLTEPQPLRCLFVLNPDATATQISTRRWSESQAALLLPENLHGSHFARSFIGVKAFQTRVQKLAEQTSVHVLSYPKRFDQIPHLIETMRELSA